MTEPSWKDHSTHCDPPVTSQIAYLLPGLRSWGSLTWQGAPNEPPFLTTPKT